MHVFFFSKMPSSREAEWQVYPGIKNKEIQTVRRYWDGIFWVPSWIKHILFQIKNVTELVLEQKLIKFFFRNMQLYWYITEDVD